MRYNGISSHFEQKYRVSEAIVTDNRISIEWDGPDGNGRLEATSTDKFAQEAAVGDRVSGRIIQVRGNKVTVQLGEGVEGICILEEAEPGARRPHCSSTPSPSPSPTCGCRREWAH